jgi:hypothetical protein
MAISCDSSGDEYYMTNRVFKFTSGSTGKKTVGYGCCVRLKMSDAKEILYSNDLFGWQRSVLSTKQSTG